MAIDVVWTVLTVLAIVALVPNIASIVQGVLLQAQVRRAMRLVFGAFLPPAVVILPIRGLDPGLEENLRAILSQSYPRYRVLVVGDDPSDPAVAKARDLARSFPHVGVTIAIAEASALPGKVNAVRSALAHLESGDEIVVFADSDIRPSKDWLRQLVQPLADSTVGVATGFRWYVSPKTTFWSLVRSEWNAVSANVLFDPRRAFAWGGSCAVRRDTLPRLRLADRWRNVLSDDLILTAAVREAGLQIAYSPAALVPTFEGATRATCMEWCLRQMTMATLYLPIVRRYAASAFAVFNGSVILGVLALIVAAFWGPAYLVPAFLFLAPLPSTIAKASLRRRALFSCVPPAETEWRVPSWRAALAALAVPWIMASALVRTRHPRTVQWRGRVYDVRDPHAIRLVDSGPTLGS